MLCPQVLCIGTNLLPRDECYDSFVEQCRPETLKILFGAIAAVQEVRLSRMCSFAATAGRGPP